MNFKWLIFSEIPRYAYDNKRGHTVRYRAKSFISLMVDINKMSSFSRCPNGIFPGRNN